MKKQDNTTTLSSPGKAAAYLENIMAKPGWGVIHVSLSELQQFNSYFQKDWDKEIVHDYTRGLLEIKKTIHNSFDLVTALSPDSYVIITQQEKVPVWEDELNKQFTSLVLNKIPHTLLNGQTVVVIADEVFPVPSLIFGIVTSKDGVFSEPVEVYHAVMENRKKNERSTLEFKLNSLMVNQLQLQEECRMIKAHPQFHSLVSHFTRISTGYFHDIRNGLNILTQQTPRIQMPEEKNRQIQNSLQYINLLLEVLSEIRFRGIGNPEKVDIHQLVSKKIDALQYGINHPVDFENIEQTVVVYTNPHHIIVSLFALLSFFKLIIKKHSAITVACGISEKNGFIEIKGEVNVDINTIVPGDSGVYEVDKYWPYPYIFTKIIRRVGGSIEVNTDNIFIFLPLYDYQDKYPLHSIKKRISIVENEISTLKAAIKKEVKSDMHEPVTAKALEPAIPLLHEFIKALQKHTQKLTELVPKTEDTENTLEMLLAGSRYCILLAENLLSFGGNYINTTEKTDVYKVFTLVRSILHYRLSQVVEYEISISENIPAVHATETALAQVIINLIMNSLEELARVKPPIPRLSLLAKEEEKHVVISIIDTGAGIPGDIIEFVMKSTKYNGDENPGEKPGVMLPGAQGTGLLVVKSIIDIIGGQLEFKVQPDKGTTVRIYLRKWEERK